MAEIKYVNFKPRWMQNLTEADRILEDTPLTGSPPEGPPRILVRILTTGSSALSALTVGEALGVTQDVVRYAGADVCHGINPDFADLRSLSTEVLGLTRLTIDPFESGSFVIPALLEAAPLGWKGSEQPRQISADDVVRRFGQMLADFEQPRESAPASIGAIQAIESLGRLIRREAQAIEFSSFDALGQPLRPVKVDAAFVGRVSETRQARQPTRARQETLEGTITALDLSAGTLQLTLAGQGRRVKGTFSMLFQPSLVRNLGNRIRLLGQVERRGKQVVSIQVVSAEVPDDEA